MFYEVIFVMRPDVPNNSVDETAEKFAELVRKHKGKVAKVENWGLRTLAYKVGKHRKGYYVMLGIEGNGRVVDELERNFKLSEDVIRFLTVKADEISAEPSVMMRAKARQDRDDTEMTPFGAIEADIPAVTV
jgi:small subunit ribosomal protein S6